MKNLLQSLIKMYQSHPGVDEDDVLKKVTEEGFEENDVEKAMAFLPLAFGRVLLSDMPFVFESEYEIIDFERNRLYRGKLKDEPTYCECERCAKEWFGKDQKQAELIAQMSAEVQVVTQMTENGSKTEDIRFTRPVMGRLEMPSNFVKWKRWYEFWK